MEFKSSYNRNPIIFLRKNFEICFCTVRFLGFVVDVLSIDHHIDGVFGELIQPSLVRIVTAVWFGI